MDPCILYGDDEVMVFIYVDDMLITGRTQFVSDDSGLLMKSYERSRKRLIETNMESCFQSLNLSVTSWRNLG